jgi:hypothetical protein
MWGLTASDGARGYMAWAHLGFSRDESEARLCRVRRRVTALRAARMSDRAASDARKGRRRGLGKIWIRRRVQSPDGWRATLIAIDNGIMLVMAENLQSGFVWQNFMRAPEVKARMQLAGFSRRMNKTR